MRLVVKQSSGLGNQLFQYAAGCYYARQNRASLRVAIEMAPRAISHGTYPRPFLLSHFSLTAPAEPIHWLDRLYLSGVPLRKRASAPLKKALGIQIFTEPVEQRYRFLRSLPLAPGTRTLYLLGYWQAHGMVDAVEEHLRREFRFREPAAGKNLAMQQRIEQDAEPVSIHIRRGDYALAAEGNVVLPGRYYSEAIARLRERLKSPVFYVFSDDIPFAKGVLPADIRKVFVEHNDDYSSHEDLRLMSSCRHHIIANSTFSWWGAWLNGRFDKMVVAPKHWHLREDSYYPDLLPSAWMLLDTNLR